MLGIEYFGSLEQYHFKKNEYSEFFSRSVTSPMSHSNLEANYEIWRMMS